MHPRMLSYATHHWFDCAHQSCCCVLRNSMTVRNAPSHFKVLLEIAMPAFHMQIPPMPMQLRGALPAPSSMISTTGLQPFIHRLTNVDSRSANMPAALWTL